MLKLLPYLLAAVFLGLLLAIIDAATRASLWEQGGDLVDMAWGRVTLLDLYIGFFLFSGLIYYWEKKNAIGKNVFLPWLLWTLALIFTGNLASVLYLFIHRSRFRSGLF